MTRRITRRILALATGVGLTLAAGMLGGGAAAAGGREAPPVTAPSGFQADVGPSSTTVTWEPSASGAEIIVYIVKLDDRRLWTVEPTMTFHLDRDRTYRLEVKAIDAQYRHSDWSEPFEFTTSEEFPVTTPGNVRVSQSPGTATVEWDPSSSDAGVVDYVVTVRGAPIGTIGRRTHGATTVTFDIPPGGDLDVTVKARDSAYRWSDSSEPVEFTLEPAENWELPSSPTNFQAAPDASGDGVIFEWDAPSSGVEPFTYHIHLDGVAVDRAQETRLDSPYFVECTSDRQQSMEFFVTATSHGFESPPSNSITLCFA